MNSRRLLFYAVADLVIWGLIGYALASDGSRLRFWWSANQVFRGIAECAGNLALRCEGHYYRVVNL